MKIYNEHKYLMKINNELVLIKTNKQHTMHTNIMNSNNTIQTHLNNE